MNSNVALSIHEAPIRLAVGNQWLNGDLAIPEAPKGLVVFAHGSGSSRKSPRNRAVAATLQEGGFATLLLDLLTMQEESVDEFTGEHRFDIDLLARRLVLALDWAQSAPATRSLAIGLFGASTGAAAALVAAAHRPNSVAAVVSRGGRPDLAGIHLARVRAPTLMIVGGADSVVIDLNREAMARMQCVARLEIVPQATHLFPEQGALERVSALARDWFTRYVATVDGVAGPH